eukprot:CAMPEP_0114304266 /NCGR_PEP_ID=MMETSP0059-20121206/15690_1 /TAXON_ID=36894 /ORGANISM="Pyramimonas parkeae, Strain CCMP726" /LENGTH=255 /DNA_ID=CAMNT_0001427343 /DNA_START=62 /DNA_END=830 /DNA_ORIENTATION=+
MVSFLVSTPIPFRYSRGACFSCLGNGGAIDRARPVTSETGLRTSFTSKGKRQVSTNAFLKNIFKGGNIQTSSVQNNVRQAKRELFELVDGGGRGLGQNKKDRAAIEERIDILETCQVRPTTGPDLSAVWELVWTTEKETLFLLEKGIFAVGPAQESYQVIDLDKGLLQNVILFGEEGESKFAVNSSIEAVSRTRCNFAFTGARLQTPKLSLGLPPLGKGWFETVYMDRDLRVARDVRGDTLIVKRTNLALDTFTT